MTRKKKIDPAPPVSDQERKDRNAAIDDIRDVIVQEVKRRKFRRPAFEVMQLCHALDGQPWPNLSCVGGFLACAYNLKSSHVSKIARALGMRFVLVPRAVVEPTAASEFGVALTDSEPLAENLHQVKMKPSPA
jgi:hypothetical protein